MEESRQEEDEGLGEKDDAHEDDGNEHVDDANENETSDDEVCKRLFR